MCELGATTWRCPVDTPLIADHSHARQDTAPTQRTVCDAHVGKQM